MHVLVAHHRFQDSLGVDALDGTVTTLHDAREVVGDELDAAGETLLVELAVAAVGGVVDGLQGTDLLGVEAGPRGELLVGGDGLWDGGLQAGELLLGALEVDLGRGGDGGGVVEVDLGREGAAHEEHTSTGEVGHVRRDEEAREREGAAGHARHEDVGGVERDHLWKNLLHQVVDCLGVGDAVHTRQALGLALGLAPKELLCRDCENGL